MYDLAYCLNGTNITEYYNGFSYIICGGAGIGNVGVYTVAQQVSDQNAVIAQYLIDNPQSGSASPN